MMCCCREVDEQDGPAAERDRAAPGIEEHPATSARVVRLATFDDDLISPVEADQLTNNQSKNRRRKTNSIYIFIHQTGIEK